jgi:hypothetical protein
MSERQCTRMSERQSARMAGKIPVVQRRVRDKRADALETAAKSHLMDPQHGCKTQPHYKKKTFEALLRGLITFIVLACVFVH